MEKRRKIKFLSAIVALSVAVCIFAVASFAWLKSNADLDSNGMQMQVDATANLVISKSTVFSGETAITLNAVNRALMPAMHTDTGDTLLRRVKDSAGIKASTGLADRDLTDSDYAAVALEIDSKYYIDYVVYVASEGKALTGATLTAAITAPVGDTVPYHQAASIDFYADGIYKGTLNLAGLDIASNHSGYSASAAKTEVVLWEAGRIPSISDTYKNHITVTMRCYFDGALRDSASSTYVTSDNLEVTNFTLGVLFSAMGNEADPS